MRKCPKCGASFDTNGAYCPSCGAPVAAQTAHRNNAPIYETGSTQVQRAIDVNDLPDNFKPLSPWAYVGYMLLYAIPIVGFIFLIINSTGAARNINKRNFARSYWAALVIEIAVAIAVFAIMAATGVSIGSLLSN